MQHVIQPPQEPSFVKVGIEGRIFETSHLTNRLQHFLVDTEHGHETEIVEHGCDFIYYVLSGSGEFTINANAEPCTAGDLVVIPAGTRFTYKGTLKMFATSTPPWWESQEETIG